MAERAWVPAPPSVTMRPSAPSTSAALPLPAPSATGRREDVLHALRSVAEPQSIATLASQLQLHPNTVRFHLDSLIAAGRVRQADAGPRRRGRPALLYEAVQGMDPGGPRGYATLAEILTIGVAAQLEPESLAREAGRRWGEERARSLTRGTVVDRLVGLLAELGFAPERSADEQRSTDEQSVQIGLRHCPFLELAESHTDVVCPIHLGLMQGAMDTWGSALTVTRLEPFVEPDLCVAHLSAAD